MDVRKSETPTGRVVFLEPESFARDTKSELPQQLETFVKSGGTVIVTRSRPSQKVSDAPRAASKSKPALPVPSLDVGFDKKPKKGVVDDILADVSREAKPSAKPKGDASWSWMLPVKLPLSQREIFQSRLPETPTFSGIGMSELYWQGLLDFNAVELKGDSIADSGIIGEVPYGKGRIVFVQFEPDDFEASWQRSKILRIYNSLLTNLGIKSTIEVDLRARGGEGTAEEWLPGFSDQQDAEGILSRGSLHYLQPALDFDPYQHHVW